MNRIIIESDSARIEITTVDKSADEKTEIARLRTILRKCMGGSASVDIGDGEYLQLFLHD